MTLFRLSSESIVGLDRASFRDLGITERGDLQRILRDHISVIVPDALVISEEFSSWDRSDRRIDLLAVDRKGCLVVIELKRTSDDSFADLQALRYAAMVAQMTFEQAVDVLGRYLDRRGIDDDPQSMLVRHLCWVDPDEGPFNENVRIVLAAADFSPEVTSTVLWLNERDLDITCVRLQPYRLNGEILLDVQQIIPLPEAADYQVQIRQKQREVRAAIAHSSDWTKYDVRPTAPPLPNPASPPERPRPDWSPHPIPTIPTARRATRYADIFFIESSGSYPLHGAIYMPTITLQLLN